MKYLLTLVAEGRISLSYAAELLDVSVYDLQREAGIRGVELGPMEEQRRQSHKLVAKLAKR